MVITADHFMGLIYEGEGPVTLPPCFSECALESLFLQGFAGLEVRNLLGGILFLLPCSRNNALSGGPFLDTECTESDECDLVTGFNYIADTIDEGIHRCGGVFLGKISLGGDMVDEFFFCSISYPFHY